MSGSPGTNQTYSLWYEYCSRMALAKLGYTSPFEKLEARKAEVFMRITGFVREWESEEQKKRQKRR